MTSKSNSRDSKAYRKTSYKEQLQPWDWGRAPKEEAPTPGLRSWLCWRAHSFDSLDGTEAIIMLVGQICWKCIFSGARESYSWEVSHWRQSATKSSKKVPGKLLATWCSWLPQTTGAGHWKRHTLWKSHDLMDPPPVSTLEQ